MLILGRPDVEALLDLDALNDALGAAMSVLSAGACSRCGILRAGARRSRRRLRDNYATVLGAALEQSVGREIKR